MIRKFVDYLRQPETGQKLQLFEFESNANNVIEGVLINSSGNTIYPIISGVPVMLEKSITSAFISKHNQKLSDLKVKFPLLKINPFDEQKSWSFSLEWDYFSDNQMSKTWGLTSEDRYKRFLHENQVQENMLKNMLILDAGCGNGKLTENIAGHGTTIIGIDYSDSVFAAEKNRKSENVFFVKGDLQSPPFSEELFDIIFSNGVIHHTPNTKATFKKVAKLVKPNGTLYVWLYNRQGGFFWKIKRYIFDILRMIFSRLPDSFKKLGVNTLTFLIYHIHRLLGDKLEYEVLKLDIYDAITPRWRHYHEPLEVQEWYRSENYSKMLITNWETLFGFGILGTKNN